jgi:hypothetical protein
LFHEAGANGMDQQADGGSTSGHAGSECGGRARLLATAMPVGRANVIEKNSDIRNKDIIVDFRLIHGESCSEGISQRASSSSTCSTWAVQKASDESSQEQNALAN